MTQSQKTMHLSSEMIDRLGVVGCLIGSAILLGSAIYQPGAITFVWSIGLTLMACSIPAAVLIRQLREGSLTEGWRITAVGTLYVQAATLVAAIFCALTW
jgi:hypothetical protein